MLLIRFTYISLFIVFVAQVLCEAQISTLGGVLYKSPSNFKSISSLSSFPNAGANFQSPLLSDTGTSGTFRQSSFSFPLGNSFSSAIASASASAASPIQTSQLSTIASPPLDAFISSFTKEVQNSQVLIDLFDISQTSLQSLKSFTYQAVCDVLKNFHISNPYDLATYASNPITDNFEHLSYPVLAIINANAISKLLLAEGILNQSNAVSLALAFANEMERSAKQTVEKNNPQSKFWALKNGYIEFIKSQGLYSPKNMQDAAKYFGDEFILAGSRFGKKTSIQTLTNVQ